MNLHDVIRELIDLAAGITARLSPARAAELHAAVSVAETAAAGQSVTGPDVSPEPAESATSVPAEPARVL